MVYTISVQEISKDAVMVTAKACELLVLDLTLRALHNMNDRGRTSLTVCFDFLVYVYAYMRNVYCIYILHTLHIHIYIHKYKRAYLYIRTYTPTIYILHTTYIILIHACMHTTYKPAWVRACTLTCVNCNFYQYVCMLEVLF